MILKSWSLLGIYFFFPPLSLSLPLFNLEAILLVVCECAVVGFYLGLTREEEETCLSFLHKLLMLLLHPALHIFSPHPLKENISLHIPTNK